MEEQVESRRFDYFKLDMIGSMISGKAPGFVKAFEKDVGKLDNHRRDAKTQRKKRTIEDEDRMVEQMMRWGFMKEDPRKAMKNEK